LVLYGEVNLWCLVCLI